MRPTRDRRRAIVLVLSWLCAGLLVAASLAIVLSGSPTGDTADGGPDSVYQGPGGAGALPDGSVPGAGTAPLTTTADQSPARGADDGLSIVGGTEGSAALAGDGAAGPAGQVGTAAGSDGGTTGGTIGGGTSGGSTGGTSGGGTTDGGTSGGGTSGGSTGGTSGGGTSGGGDTSPPPPEPEPTPEPAPTDPCLCDTIPEVPLPVPTLPSDPLPEPIPSTLETVESTVDGTTGTLGLGG